MGEVFLAVRDDQDFTNHAAIKLIRRGLDTEDIVRRFRMERQILASLNHPHIARLFDGGTTEDGKPYFVMEYVAGEPITDFCDRRRLSIDARLELFGQVCSAVHYAHQNLVVHRDLKPSNILVTPEGVPKLLDFGIAKVLSPGADESSKDLTRTEMRVLTPEYASPEQVRGEVITTASDVYALGVLLYELLTGRRPYRLSSRVRHEIERVICEEEPIRPSTAVTQIDESAASGGMASPEAVSRARNTPVDRLRRRLAGDLDNIVLMAMRKEPSRRYSSAEQLAEDVWRHLHGHPVSARRDTLFYRAQKFVHRHRVGVVSASVIALLLVGSTAGMAIQSAQIRAKSVEAERERETAEEVATFLEGLFQAADPYEEVRGDTLTARALLDRGRERITARLSSNTVVQARLMAVIATAYERLSLYDEGEELARSALTNRQNLYGQDHEEVAQSLRQLALFRRRKGDYAAAESLNVLALSIQRRLHGDGHVDVARSLGALATVLQNRGNHEAAEPLFRESLAIYRSLGEEHPELPTSLNDLALILHLMGRFAEAAPLYDEALATYRRLLGDEHPEIASTLHNLAMLRRDEGDYELAHSLEREALSMRRRLLGDDHMLVANSLTSLGSILRMNGDFAGAEPLYREALAILRKSLPEGHSRTSIALRGLGAVLVDLGAPDEAEPLLREALEGYLQGNGPVSLGTARAKFDLGRCLSALARFAEAETLLLESFNAFTGEKDSTGVRRSRKALETLYRSWGKEDLAQQYARTE